MDNIKFYPQPSPKQEDVVIVKVTKVAEVGVYCKLMEYPNYHGLILLSEMSKRRIRSVAQLTRVGKLEPCVIMRIDTNSKQVDMSKSKVSREDSEKAMEKYLKTKNVLSFVMQISRDLNFQVDDLVEKIVYPLFKDKHHPLDVFEMVSRGKDFKDFYSKEEYENITSNLPENTLDRLTELIKKKIVIKPYYIRSDVNCIYYGVEGVEMLKEAFRKVEPNVTVRYISAPKYIFETTNTNMEEGINILNISVKNVKDFLISNGGNLSIAENARVLGDNDKDKNIIVESDSENDSDNSDNDENEEDIKFDEKLEQKFENLNVFA